MVSAYEIMFIEKVSGLVTVTVAVYCIKPHGVAGSIENYNTAKPGDKYNF